MIIAGIVAGGSGLRMGNSKMPKQFLLINDKPIIVMSIENFLNNSNIDYIVVAINVEYKEHMQNLINEFFSNYDNILITEGGDNRTETVNNIVEFSLKTLHLDSDTIFLTHDAVRPFISDEIINENIRFAQEFGICNTVIPATDTIINSNNGMQISQIPVRNELFLAQTPQSFSLNLYKEVYNSLTLQQKENATDTCSLFFSCGKTVHLTQGDVNNIKITYPIDLKIAKVIADSRNE